MAEKSLTIRTLGFALFALCAFAVRANDESDSFQSDSTGRYLVTDTLTKGGVGQFLYDTQGRRVLVLTGDNIGLQFSREVFAAASGRFRIDFTPSGKHPKGGIVIIRLVQDAGNYYEIKNTDGYGAGKVWTFVDGRKWEAALLGGGYAQHADYRIDITFGPVLTRVEAFGSSIVLERGAEILVRRFEVEVKQQDAFFDNLLFQSSDPAAAVSAALRWDANSEPNLRGYKVYYKTGAPGAPYDGRGLLQGDSPILVPVEALDDRANPSFVLDWPNIDETYRIAVTAYDDRNNESGVSNEVVFSPEW